MLALIISSLCGGCVLASCVVNVLKLDNSMYGIAAFVACSLLVYVVLHTLNKLLKTQQTVQTEKTAEILGLLEQIEKHSSGTDKLCEQVEGLFSQLNEATASITHIDECQGVLLKEVSDTKTSLSDLRQDVANESKNTGERVDRTSTVIKSAITEAADRIVTDNRELSVFASRIREQCEQNQAIANELLTSCQAFNTEMREEIGRLGAIAASINNDVCNKLNPITQAFAQQNIGEHMVKTLDRLDSALAQEGDEASLPNSLRDILGKLESMRTNLEPVVEKIEMIKKALWGDADEDEDALINANIKTISDGLDTKLATHNKTMNATSEAMSAFAEELRKYNEEHRKTLDAIDARVTVMIDSLKNQYRILKEVGDRLK